MVRPRHLLVTGGAGFLGLWIIRQALRRGVSVRSFDRVPPNAVHCKMLGIKLEDVVWCTGDIRDPSAVRQAVQGMDYAIHSAGIDLPGASADPASCFEVNGSASVNFFDECCRAGVKKIVFTSSAAATCAPATVYGAVKLATECALLECSSKYQIASASIRPFVIVGLGRQHGLSAALTDACQAAAEGGRFDLPFSGTSWFIAAETLASMHIDEMLRSSHRQLPLAANGLAGDISAAARCLKLAGAVDIGVYGPALPSFVPISRRDLVRDADKFCEMIERCVSDFRTDNERNLGLVNVRTIRY